MEMGPEQPQSLQKLLETIDYLVYGLLDGMSRNGYKK